MIACNSTATLLVGWKQIEQHVSNKKAKKLAAYGFIKLKKRNGKWRLVLEELQAALEKIEDAKLDLLDLEKRHGIKRGRGKQVSLAEIAPSPAKRKKKRVKVPFAGQFGLGGRV